MDATATMNAEPCKPNIGEVGRRLRTDFGWRFLVVSVLAFGLLFFLRAAWYWRALVAIPAALSAVGFLQARRGTCVARAAEGMVEHDDLSRTKAPDGELRDSRRVAAGIHRDTLLIALAAAAIGVASALVR